jgi:hypothetical protein
VVIFLSLRTCLDRHYPPSDRLSQSTISYERFPTNPPVNAGVIVREAIWVGIYFPTLAWLQLGQVLTPALSLLLAVGLLAIEVLLRLRERSQWKP